jgi:hypothetical protein
VLHAKLGILVLAGFFFVLLITPSFVWAQQNGASSAISAAQSQLVSCFDAARSAEAAGANISQLTHTLNVAGSLLSNAELAYSSGDFGAAQSLASQSQSQLSDFVSTANSMRASASQSQTVSFLVNIVGSIAGTVAVFVGSFFVWRFLKRRYGRSEVANRESDTV